MSLLLIISALPELDFGWSRATSKRPLFPTTILLCYYRCGVNAKTQHSMLPLQSIVTLVGEMDDDNRKDDPDTKWKETVRKISDDLKEGWEGSREEAARKTEDMKQRAKDLYFQYASLENVSKVRLLLLHLKFTFFRVILKSI